PDSLLPMGLPFDREGLAVPGGPRSGVEAAARLPLDRVLQGLALEGEAQFWSQAPEWRYAPRRSYQAQVRFHDVFLDTRNLEVWSEIGVRGRDGMPVPFADEAQEPARVPFGQSWYARLQIRVVSVRVFVLWENFTLRDSNQDLPGRILPQTRAMYGVRWTLWN
ncbi:MAG: hypothetical protein ACOCUZ_02025, partial [bacterium]